MAVSLLWKYPSYKVRRAREGRRDASAREQHMKFLRNITSLPDDCAGAVLAIGNFDGLHRGHQAVLEAAREIAGREGAPFGALTFEPHPRRVLKPDQEHFCLTPLPLKRRLMELLGLDLMVSCPFDARLSALTARRFVEQILVRDLKVRHVVTGNKFFFGKGREGNTETLKALGAELDFGSAVVDPVTFQGADKSVPLSSTSVRERLIAGDMRGAAERLGYWWQVLGRVVQGDKRGRGLGFPTANIVLERDVKPKFGVYAVRTRVLNAAFGKALPGVANLGLRPTFARDEAVLEVHLFDFDGDLYGKELLVELISFIRPERKFDGLDALKAQIAADAETARGILAAMARDGDPMAAYPIGGILADARALAS